MPHVKQYPKFAGYPNVTGAHPLIPASAKGPKYPKLPIKNKDPIYFTDSTRDRLNKISLNCLNDPQCSYRGTLASYDTGHYKQAGAEYVSLRCPRCFCHQGRLKVDEILSGMTEGEIQATLREVR